MFEITAFVDLQLKFKDFSINVNKLTLKSQLAKRVLTPESKIVRIFNNCRQTQRSSSSQFTLFECYYLPKPISLQQF